VRLRGGNGGLTGGKQKVERECQKESAWRGGGKHSRAKNSKGGSSNLQRMALQTRGWHVNAVGIRSLKKEKSLNRKWGKTAIAGGGVWAGGKV